MSLANEKCVPCRGDVKPMSREEAESFVAGFPSWALDEGATRITRTFRFGDFAGAMEFARRIGDAAEEQGHHPDLALGWGYCTVTFSTHRIHGLHRNDFVMAARVDRIAGEEGGSGGKESPSPGATGSAPRKTA